MFQRRGWASTYILSIYPLFLCYKHDIRTPTLMYLFLFNRQSGNYSTGGQDLPNYHIISQGV